MFGYETKYVNHLFACFHYLMTLLSFVSCFGLNSEQLSFIQKKKKTKTKIPQEMKTEVTKIQNIATQRSMKSKENSPKYENVTHSNDLMLYLMSHKIKIYSSSVIQCRKREDKTNAKVKQQPNFGTETEINEKNYAYKNLVITFTANCRCQKVGIRKEKAFQKRNIRSSSVAINSVKRRECMTVARESPVIEWKIS